MTDLDELERLLAKTTIPLPVMYKAQADEFRQKYVAALAGDKP